MTQNAWIFASVMSASALGDVISKSTVLSDLYLRAGTIQHAGGGHRRDLRLSNRRPWQLGCCSWCTFGPCVFRGCGRHVLARLQRHVSYLCMFGTRNCVLCCLDHPNHYQPWISPCPGLGSGLARCRFEGQQQQKDLMEWHAPWSHCL